MPVSPRKNVSYINNSTVNKGVQAREIDITNVRLDTDTLSLSRAATESSEWPADTWGYRAGNAGGGEVPGRKDGAMAAGDAPIAPTSLTPPSTDQSVSYVQITALESSAVPAAVLLACPAFTALHQQPWDKARGLMEAGSRGIQAASTNAHISEGQDTVRQSEINNEKVKHQYFWKKVHCSYKNDADDYDDALPNVNKVVRFYYRLGNHSLDNNNNLEIFKTRPLKTTLHPAVSRHYPRCVLRELLQAVHAKRPDCLEVYEFDHGCEALVARVAGPVPHIERCARRASRPAAALFAEMLAVPRLALAVPVHIALQLQRCVLLGVREVATGVVQTTSDALLKPLLALAFNAVLRPPLVCVAQLAQAIREALRPLTLAMSDALEPLARLLAAVRLVQIDRHCTCACAHHV